MPSLENQGKFALVSSKHAEMRIESNEDISLAEGAKLNRGEKKCRKALTKLGMKAFPGITRVTIKKRDGFIFMINDPEVLVSGDNGNQFVCFGELKYDDPNQRMAQAEAAKMAQAQAAARAAQANAPAASKKGENSKAAASDEAAEDESGITPSHIGMVMEHTNCTRNQAIRALRESNDDMINAVMKLSGS